MTESTDVVIIGAGLAGLRAAQILEAAGRNVVIVERSTRIGGRVATRHIDGFTIDEGFQLLNPSYPELRATGVLGELSLCPLPASIVIQRDGRDRVLALPYRDVTGSLAGALHGAVPWRDLVPLLRLGARVSRGATPRFLNEVDCSTSEGWASLGLSPTTVATILQPFLQGVLLEREFSTSWQFTQLALRSFLRGVPAVPHNGMSALPAALRRRAPEAQVRLAEEAVSVLPTRVVTTLGEYHARHVIVATNEVPAETQWRSVTTWWFACPPISDGRLRVDADSPLLANAVALSASAPSYAPPTAGLVAASVLGPYDVAQRDAVREAVARRFDLATSEVHDIVATPIPRALPVVTRRRPGGAQWRDGVLVAGDSTSTPSIQGALVSGRHAAEAVLAR